MKPQNPFHKPYQPSEPLAAVIGSDPISRPQATKKVWDYIKREKLQGTKDRQSITIDEKLGCLFDHTGRPPGVDEPPVVSMFEIPKMLKRELLPI